MGAMFTLFLIIMTLLLFGMIGDKDATNRKNFTYAFCVVTIVVGVMVVKGM